MALEEVHVLDSAEVSLERGRHDNDGNLRASAAKLGGDFCAELAGAEVVVEHGDIDLVEELVGFFDSGSHEGVIAVLAKDCGAEMQVDGIVVEQQDGYARRAYEFEAGGCGWLCLH
jgi:hypothetical protein